MVQFIVIMAVFLSGDVGGLTTAGDRTLYYVIAGFAVFLALLFVLIIVLCCLLITWYRRSG